MTTDTTTHEQGAATSPPWEVVGPAADEQAAGQAPTTALTVFDPIEQTLAEIEARHKGVVYDLTTTKGNDAARKARKELVSVRTTADEVYKTWNQPLLAAQKKARELRDGFAARVQLLEKPLDDMIKADEERRATEKKLKDEAEAKRVKTIRDRIAEIYAEPAACVGLASGAIEASIADVEKMVSDKAFFEEMQAEAEAAADVVLTKLRAMMSAAQAAEERAEQQRVEADRLAAERAELERQRAELAAQQEAARIAAERAEQERQAAAIAEAARIEAERLAAEEEARKRQAEIDESNRLAAEELERTKREADARLAEEQRALDERRAQLERDEQESRNRKMREALDAMPVAAPLVRTEKPGANGSTVVHYLPATPPFGGVDPKFCPGSNPDNPQEDPRVDEDPKPPVTEQTDAFEAERQVEAARAAALPKPAIKRPDDERLTAAIAKAFDVEPAIAAEWLGTYDAFEEIARLVQPA